MHMRLSTRQTNRACNDECSNRGDEAWGKPRHLHPLGLANWEGVFVVVNRADNLVWFLKKYPVSTKIVRRWVETDNEVLGKRSCPSISSFVFGSIKMFANGVAVYPT